MIAKKNVLVVSRDLSQFIDEAALFEKAGYSIRLATDNEDAVSKIAKDLPDLVISELAMVDIDGLDLCRSIRRIQAAKKLPIVLVGDLPKRSPIVIDAGVCGASVYFQRPTEPADLVRQAIELSEFEAEPKRTPVDKGTRRSKKPERQPDIMESRGYCWVSENAEKGAFIKVYLPRDDRGKVGFSLRDTFPNSLSLVGAEEAASRLAILIQEACQVMVVEKSDNDYSSLAFAE